MRAMLQKQSNPVRFMRTIRTSSGLPPSLVWANFCPRKYLWEVSQIPGVSLHPGEWWQQTERLDQALWLLRSHGVQGLRLNIFNFELLPQAYTPDWTPAITFLSLAKKHGLAIDWCLGPFQYPLWPGIRLPADLNDEIPSGKESIVDLSQVDELHAWAMWWAKTQLEFLSHFPTVKGVYLENEWHTAQAIEGETSPIPPLYSLSSAWLAELATLATQFPSLAVLCNTNLDISQTSEIQQVFAPLRLILGAQFQLGLDVYPSRVTWKATPRLWLVHHRQRYARAVRRVEQELAGPIFWGEFEAQPWGTGQSWVKWWQQRVNQEVRESYSPDWLWRQYDRYFQFLPERKITLWGAEFWLVSELLGYHNPLDQVMGLAQLTKRSLVK